MMSQDTNKSSSSGRPKGIVTIEFVLVISVLTALGFGLVEFAQFFSVKNMLEGAAREGARNAISSAASNSTVTSTVQNVIACYSYPANTTSVAITDLSGNAVDVSTAPFGTKIKVTVSATWGTIGAGSRPLGLINSAKTVMGSAVMVKEK